MASLHFSGPLSVPAEVAWDFIDRYTRAEVHVFSMCTDEWLEDDVRVVSLTDGTIVRERNVTIDPQRMRASYAIPGVYGAEHHHAEMRVNRAPGGAVELEWLTDYLPHGLIDGLYPTYERCFRELVEAIEAHVPDRTGA
jgi:hypothetical protein